MKWNNMKARIFKEKSISGRVRFSVEVTRKWWQRKVYATGMGFDLTFNKKKRSMFKDIDEAKEMAERAIRRYDDYKVISREQI